MNKFILREQYINKTKPFINKQIIKVYTGQRRVGKSYIIKQLIAYIKSHFPNGNIIYINKEDFQFDAIREANDLHDYIRNRAKKSTMNYIFIDEIQEIKGFEKVIRSLVLDDSYDIYCTGSNAYMLSGELSTFLSGRYIEIPIYSLSFSEFLIFHNLEKNDENLFKYLKYGGLPYLKHLALEDEIVYGYLKSIYNTIIYRDVIIRNEIRNTAFLENLTLFLADNIGQLFSATKISKYLKSQNVNIATSQIISYLKHLCNSYIIYKVNRTDIVGKKIFEIGEKYFFEDLGLRNAIFTYKLDDIGKIMENVVYIHLLRMGYEVHIGQQGKNEIDFVAKHKGETKYIQVCYLLQDEKTIEREFGNLEKIKDNYPKMVVSMDKFQGNTRNGIEHINLLDFLMQNKI